ncbi:MAG: YdbL family protein [Halothiobacillaceae bacterium]
MTAIYRSLIGFALLAMTTACVTINIYFPAAAAEEAARTIVRDVLGSEAEAAPGQPTPEAAPQAPAEPEAHNRYSRMVLAAATVLVGEARAEADLSIRSPAIDALRASMRARAGKLAPFYADGTVGFNRQGLVEIRSLDGVPLNRRAELNQLVAQENEDRNALYREIAQANGRPDWEGQIRDTFARVWAEEAPAGAQIQRADGSWTRK